MKDLGFIRIRPNEKRPGAVNLGMFFGFLLDLKQILDKFELYAMSKGRALHL